MTELPPQGTCLETGPSAVILKAASGDYLGEGGTLNSNRDYAKVFASEAAARADAHANRVYSNFTAEAAIPAISNCIVKE